ncbi:PREDICTED: selenoprotein K-like [Tarenaya hassleriana]|uniref:selenoprotein K-like n=1 Tax=Tarenaya hassleriana TaxID=28532 RepID=UPI00053C67E6|nr:PREDICTED: selenoprotein K-like [Tarenaya hassleriana]
MTRGQSQYQNHAVEFQTGKIKIQLLRLGSLQERASMAYVEGGVVKSKRSIWRLRTITDFFWSVINLVQVFFITMFSMEKSDAYRKGSGSSKKWDGGSGPGGGGGGPYGGGRGPPRGGLDNVRGLRDVNGSDHGSLPACGSCCG